MTTNKFTVTNIDEVTALYSVDNFIRMAREEFEFCEEESPLVKPTCLKTAMEYITKYHPNLDVREITKEFL